MSHINTELMHINTNTDDSNNFKTVTSDKVVRFCGNVGRSTTISWL